MLLPCRWRRIIEMFEVSRERPLCVWTTCHQTKQLVATASSVFFNRIACLDRLSGGNIPKVRRFAGSAVPPVASLTKQAAQVRPSTASSRLKVVVGGGVRGLISYKYLKSASLACSAVQ